MAAGNQALWKGVCATVGRADLLADPRFTDTSARARNQGALRDILEAIFAEDDAQAWLARFRAAGVPCAPINTYSEVLADPQVEHMGWVQPVELPNGVQTRTFGLPVRFDGETTALRRRPPALGEHNDEVLGALRAAGKGAAT
ncbi:Formyl-coenzyme A transferase [compost metagenome]